MTAFQNPFLLDKKQYVRDINPVRHYVQQMANFLHISNGASLDECEAFIKEALSNKSLGAVDPKLKYLEREENGDRAMQEGTLMEYIREAVKAKDLIAPTLTTYLHPEVKESILVNFVDDNVKARGVAKKAMFAAEAKGDMEVYAFKSNEQTGVKLSNNAVSGALVSPSTPLYNPTGHSTLTSTCRSTSGYGNANNEKLLSGNRHYWSPNIVINNIVSIITNTDYVRLSRVMNTYQLHYPSAAEVIDCITYSSDLYWKSPKRMEQIVFLVERLNPLQRAAFVYTGDLFHLMKYNDAFVRAFITKLSNKIEGTLENALAAVKSVHEDYVILAHQICAKEMKGKGVDHKAMADTSELQTLALTANNIQNTLFEYKEIIQTFWTTTNVPASVAYLPESIRRAALTSDTDSTIFTVQDWVIWYKNGLSFDERAISVAATMIFLASQNIVHVLALMSANFGIVEKRLHQIAMKNEFFFPVFVPTQVGKHYYANMSVQEGNVFEKLKMEIKGVHLKSSNAPKSITKQAHDMLERIMNTVYDGKKIKILDYLHEVGDLQRKIKKSIESGDQEFFRLQEVKTQASYKNPNSCPYNYYELWEAAFANKYPGAVQVPYPSIKVATTLDTATTTRNWLNAMEDQKVAERIRAWMLQMNKDTLPTMYIPLEMAKIHGIPKEFLGVMEIRRMISDLTKIFSLILETLGFYIGDNHMVFDRY